MRRTLTATYCVFVVICLMSVIAAPREALAADPASGWGEAVMLEFLNPPIMGDANTPHVAADAFGNAFAVWDQPDGSRNCVFANRYVHDFGWTGAHLIDSLGTDDCYNPRVAVDGSGNATVVWQQSASWVNSVWSNRYVVGEGWGTAEPIESQSEEAGLPQVVVDRSGNATAVWIQMISGQGHIWSNRYVVGEGWGVEEEAEQYVDNGYSFDVAVDDAGCVFAVWSQWEVSHYNVSANRYVPGEGWGTAVMIGGNASGDSGEPKVAVDSSGNATVVWFQSDDALYSVWSNRYVAGEGWGTAELLEDDDTDDALYPRLADDGSGTVLAVWQQRAGGVDSIWSSLYVPGDGWQLPETVEDNSLFATIPMVVMDGSGNGTAVWHQSDGLRNTICSSRYVAGEGWGDMELASTNSTGGSTSANIALDGIGNVFAVWLQEDGLRYNVWANLYISPDITPPSLSLDSPEDGLTTGTPTVTVSGLTEPSATVAINGVYAVVNEDGSFSCVIALVDGANIITVTATDVSGNSAELSVTVTYVNPVPALEQQLEDALADLTLAEEALDTALAEVAQLQDLLDNATANVTALRAQLDEAEDALADAEGLLAEALYSLEEVEDALEAALYENTVLQGNLNTTLASLLSAQDALADALDELSAAQDELDDARDELAGTEGDLDAADSLNLLLMVALVAAAAVAAVMAIMYLRVRGKAGPPA